MSLANSIGAKTYYCDGNDALHSYKVLNEIITQRNGSTTPWFINFQLISGEHCGYQYDNDLGYRSVQEFEVGKIKTLLLFLNQH